MHHIRRRQRQESAPIIVRAAAAHGLEGGVEDGVEVLHGQGAGHHLLVEELREGVHVELEPVLLVLHAQLLGGLVGLVPCRGWGCVWLEGQDRSRGVRSVMWRVDCTHTHTPYTPTQTPTCAVMDTLKDLPRRIPRTSGSGSASFVSAVSSFFPSPRARLMVRPWCSVAPASPPPEMGPASSSSSRWSFSSVASPRAPVVEVVVGGGGWID